MKAMYNKEMVKEFCKQLDCVIAQLAEDAENYNELNYIMEYEVVKGQETVLNNLKVFLENGIR